MQKNIFSSFVFLQRELITMSINLNSPYLNNIISAKQDKKQSSHSKNPYNAFIMSDNIVKSKQTKNAKQDPSIFEKIKNWLLTPVEVQNTNQNNRPIQRTRLRGIIDTMMGYGILLLLIFFPLNAGRLSGKKPILKNQNLWSNLNNHQKLEDLALPDNLKETAKKLIKMISNPIDHIKRGGDIKKTILLFGPPGTGKTTFAKAMAREIPNSKFASIDLSTIEDKFVGESQNRLNNIIDNICNYAGNNPDKKVFVFFDEIDSIALQDNGSSNQQYHASLLNVFKKAISEKLTKYENVIIFGATNVEIDKTGGSGFIQRLSPPIVDRFGIHVRVDNPTSSQLRNAIAKHYSKAPLVKEYLKDENSKEVISIADKLEKIKASFRTLENVYNSAASSEGVQIVTFEDIMNAIKKLPNITGERTMIGF